MEADARPDFAGREGFGLGEDGRLARRKGGRKRLGRLDPGREREIEDSCVQRWVSSWVLVCVLKCVCLCVLLMHGGQRSTSGGSLRCHLPCLLRRVSHWDLGLTDLTLLVGY